MALALVCLATSSAAAQLDGLAAPAGTWTTAGGSAARNGYALTQLELDQPSERWRFESAGELEGEPLVWGMRVFVSSRIDAGERSLEVVDLRSGRRLSHREFKTELPLEASIWGDVVGVRSGATEVTFFQLRGSKKPRFDHIGRVRSKAPCSGPLLFGSEAYVLTEDELLRVNARGGRTVWSQPGRFAGRVSLLGEHVVALRYDEGNGQLVRLLRESGRAAGAVNVGHHNGKLPPAGCEAFAALSPKEARLHHALPIETHGQCGHRGDPQA